MLSGAALMVNNDKYQVEVKSGRQMPVLGAEIDTQRGDFDIYICSPGALSQSRPRPSRYGGRIGGERFSVFFSSWNAAPPFHHISGRYYLVHEKR